MRNFAIILAVSTAMLTSAFAQTPVNLTPTTTVAEQTQNNTSASGTYSNPSVGTTLGNLSKLPLRQLLPGFSGKIYASVVLFWGSGKHINVGYSAADPAQVAATGRNRQCRLGEHRGRHTREIGRSLLRVEFRA